LPAAQDFWAVSVNMDTRLSSSAPVDTVTDRAGAHNWPAMVLKVVLRLVPTKVNAAIAATAINAAISAYSIAVTPD
jgi:hypothetical protein